MPSKTEKQREFFGAELARQRQGKKTVTGLAGKILSEFASKPLAKPSGKQSGKKGKK